MYMLIKLAYMIGLSNSVLAICTLRGQEPGSCSVTHVIVYLSVPVW